MKLIQKECLICGPDAQLEDLYPRTFEESDLSAHVFSARRSTEHFHYRIVKCVQCGLVFSREVLPDDRLWGLYSQSQFTFGDYTSTLRRDYWRHLAPYLEGRPRGSALEVGCSSGFFLQELAQRGYASVQGCEPSEAARNASPPQIRDSIRLAAFEGKKTFPDDRFDLVACFHTLDHLTTPDEFLVQCRTVLNEDGLVYLVVHDVESLQAKILGERSPIFDIEHIYLFSQKTLPEILRRSGFEPLAVGNFWNRYPLQYWAHLFPSPPVVKSCAESVLRATGLGRISFSIAAGNIFAVARKQS